MSDEPNRDLDLTPSETASAPSPDSPRRRLAELDHHGRLRRRSRRDPGPSAHQRPGVLLQRRRSRRRTHRARGSHIPAARHRRRRAGRGRHRGTGLHRRLQRCPDHGPPHRRGTNGLVRHRHPHRGRRAIGKAMPSSRSNSSSSTPRPTSPTTTSVPASATAPTRSSRNEPANEVHMNAALGFGFTMLGLVTSVVGCLAGIHALVNRRSRLIGQVRSWAWLLLLASVGAFTVMEIALFQRDYTVSFVQQVGSETTPASVQLRRHLVGARRFDPAVDPGALALHRRGGRQVPEARGRPVARLGDGGAVRRRRLLLRADGRSGQPVHPRRRAAGFRRARAERAPAEPPARGLPPADALRRVRRLHGAVRVRHRRPHHRSGG